MSWLVIGNGAKDIDIHSLAINANTFVFNLGFPELSCVCRIKNQKISGACSPYSIQGPQPFDGFATHMSMLHSSLQSELNNVPSSGTVLLTTLAAHQIQAKVIGMNLLPSIARPAAAPTHIPNANHFHNWLGERRHAFTQGFQHHFDWQTLILNKPQWGELNIADPFSLLQALASTPNNLTLAKLIADISADCWLNNATIDTLQQAEAYFYLQRSQQRTRNWWLYHNEASQYLANTHMQLAWCQQSLMLSR